MVNIHRTKLYLFRFRRRFLTCIPAKYDNVKKGIAHQTVSSMNTACGLSCRQEVWNRLGEAFSVNLKTAVLVMQRRIDQDRNLSHINPIVHIHTEHCRDSLLNGSLSANQLNHRCIKPYAHLSAGSLYPPSFSALADNA